MDQEIIVMDRALSKLRKGPKQPQNSDENAVLGLFFQNSKTRRFSTNCRKILQNKKQVGIFWAHSNGQKIAKPMKESKPLSRPSV